MNVPTGDGGRSDVAHLTGLIAGKPTPTVRCCLCVPHKGAGRSVLVQSVTCEHSARGRFRTLTGSHWTSRRPSAMKPRSVRPIQPRHVHPAGLAGIDAFCMGCTQSLCQSGQALLGGQGGPLRGGLVPRQALLLRVQVVCTMALQHESCRGLAYRDAVKVAPGFRRSRVG